MQPLSAHGLLEVWEQTAGAESSECALVALSAALPNCSPESLKALPLGHRDTLLLELYHRSFGGGLELYARCPECREALEIPMNTADLRGAQESHSIEEAIPDNAVQNLELTLHHDVEEKGPLRLRFRLANSADMAAAARTPDAAAAKAVLVQRLVTGARRGDRPIDPSELREDELRQLAEALAEADPRAEWLLDLDCPSCLHRWRAMLEMADLFYQRILSSARQLLREVHTLARAHGWREADILALSAGRRRAYLEMLAHG